MSERKNTESDIAEKKVSRRSMLKWTGALTAAVAAGAVAEYGASELMKPPPPPPPPSFKPPLSPEIQAKHEKIVQSMRDAHVYDRWVLTNCKQNGCRTDTCILKVLTRSGKIVAIEPDPTINPNNGYEDVGLDMVRKGRVQSRPCAMGNGWIAQIYHPKRILYPMKNVGTRGPGAKFVRITWEEALDTIEQKIKEVAEKYGPYSVFSLMTFRDTLFHIGSWIPPTGLGASGWGEQSSSGFTTQKTIMAGGSSSYGMDDHFNSKLILLWGQNPSGHTQGNYPYYLRLAREQGIPIISIDPRYHQSANVIANQWIPIRPGTDMAMVLAMANALFKEDLYDKDYISKWVEPTGFQMWKDYVLGVSEGPDGKIDRTPEWAEEITGIPAETIRALARLYAKSKPTKIMFGYGATRSDGWNVTRGLLALQAMGGYLTVAGGGDPVSGVGPGTPNPVSWPTIAWRGTAPYPRPNLLQQQMYHRAILLREKVDNGQMTKKEYDAWIGNYPAQPMPNIQMLVFVSNFINVIWGANIHTEAVKKVYSTWGIAWYTDQPHLKYLDLVLPGNINFFEEHADDPWYNTSTRFRSGGGNNNFFIYADSAIAPQGEVRPHMWWWGELARRFGVADSYNPKIGADLWEGGWNLDEWNKRIEAVHKEAYETWAKLDKISPLNPPSWDDFKKNPVFMLDSYPIYSWQQDIDSKQNPFRTRQSYDLTLNPSGKLEINIPFLGDPEKVASTLWVPDQKGCMGKINTDMVKPLPIWSPKPRAGTFLDKRATKYTLTMISSITDYRQHSANDNNPLLRDEVYRHGVWISVADAKKRAIKDGDLVRVYSEAGEMIIPAYVTPRITPGVVDIMHSAWYTPSDTKTDLMPDGIDRRGCPNYLIRDPMGDKCDNNCCIMTDLVEVEKFDA
jgi:anaerobic dimethyl sulfoxide reductase subunit A